MKKSTLLSKALILSAAVLFQNSPSFAGDFEWSGVYRLEANHIKNTELDGKGRELDYGLHHLSLRPKIVAGDGLTIMGQFELLTNRSYPNSQLGMAFGDGVGSAFGSNSDDVNVISSHQKSDSFLISQLYLSWVHEYGALIAGRAPLQFGLGITHNAGRGLFDHWFDTRDLIGYKVVMGNLYITPMYGKVNEGTLNINDDIYDYMVQVDYENPDTDLQMGVFYQVRKAADSAEPGTVTIVGGSPPSPTDFSQLNIFALKDTDRWRLGLESSFLNGKLGVKDSGGEEIAFNAFAVAGEFEYRPENSKWKYGVKAGTASGDDAASSNKFEGYVMDRNYDVAMLLFNRPLGRQDVLRTASFGGGGSLSNNKPDVEAISNALYLAPSASYQWSDHISLGGTLATGWLGRDPTVGPASNDEGSDLGYELDLSMTYSPRKGIVWVNELGMLFPGSAFDFGGEAPGFAYGLTSKAAISF